MKFCSKFSGNVKTGVDVAPVLFILQTVDRSYGNRG